jgi:hypothetical protein
VSQPENGSPSSEHSNSAPSSSDEKLKVAVVSIVVSGGLAWRNVSGAVASGTIVHS